MDNHDIQTKQRFGGIINPADYQQSVFEGSINKKNTEPEDITIYLPRNEETVSLEILIDDDAIIEPIVKEILYK